LKPSPAAAYLYVALAALAAGSDPDLEATLSALGVPADPEATGALAHLLHRLADTGGRPAASAEAPGPQEPSDGMGTDAACYLYGVVEDDGTRLPVWTGVAGHVVVGVRAGGLMALAHACPAQPFASDDRDTALRWVEEHAAVLDQALERYPALVPLRFNTLVGGTDGPAARAVRDWLLREAPTLRAHLDRVRRRREYAVRFRPASPDPGVAAPETGEAGPGTAYLLRGRREMEEAGFRRSRAAELAEACLAEVRAAAEDVVVERLTGEDPAVLLRCACLVADDRVGDFRAAMGRIAVVHGLVVEITGPWPGYSFMPRVGTEGADGPPATDEEFPGGRP